VTRKDAIVLLVLAVLVIAFVAYEMAGEELPGWHTISFIAQHNSPLAIGIGIAFPAGGIGGAVWWWKHMHSRISK